MTDKINIKKGRAPERWLSEREACLADGLHGHSSAQRERRSKG
jgi:hypothetical protein